MKFKIEIARPNDEPLINACAKMSPFTRDFTNPPMSLKQMRKEAFPNQEVLVALSRYQDSGRVVYGRPVLGFVWSRPMKPKHMPFSTVYYIGVSPDAKGLGVGVALMEAALLRAKEHRIELVAEHRNEAAMGFFADIGCEEIGRGAVGKDNRPYTRWRYE